MEIFRVKKKRGETAFANFVNGLSFNSFYFAVAIILFEYFLIKLEPSYSL